MTTNTRQTLEIVVGMVLAGLALGAGSDDWAAGRWTPWAVAWALLAAGGVVLAYVGIRPGIQRSGEGSRRGIADDVETSWDVRASAQAFTDTRIALLLCLVVAPFVAKGAVPWLAGLVLFTVAAPLARRTAIRRREG